MSTTPTRSSRETIAKVLRSINDCWLEGRPQDLSEFLHDNMVMVFPNFGGRAEGKHTVIAGYRDFCTNARVRNYDHKDLQIDVYGSTAVVSYSFAMTYEREGHAHSSAGYDLFVLANQAERWLAVWRTMTSVTDESLNEEPNESGP